ncbi:MAG: outer membrane protein assembly factor, partial [Croceibacterium sp.]
MVPRAISSNTSSPDLKRLLAALAASAALAWSPLAAQDTSTLPTLEDLIPDSAVANPETWAQQGVSPEVAATEDTAPEIDPDSPLADLPGLDLPWPEQEELPQLAPLEPEEDIQFAEFDDGVAPVAMGAEERISNELVLSFPSENSLFPEREEFLSRFKSLSTIEQLDANDNAARLSAQARADQALLERMLRVYGYFDATVFRSIASGEPGTNAPLAHPTVRFDIVPGEQYRFGAIDLGQLTAAGPDYPMLRQTFEIQPGDPLMQDKVIEERYDLDEALGEGGYPFAAISEPDLLVD